MATQSSILAWKVQGQRSLAGYSPWGYKEQDMTECTCALTSEGEARDSAKDPTMHRTAPRQPPPNKLSGPKWKLWSK